MSLVPNLVCPSVQGTMILELDPAEVGQFGGSIKSGGTLVEERDCHQRAQAVHGEQHPNALGFRLEHCKMFQPII